MWSPKPEEPCYTMKVVSDLLNLHPQTIRNYEKMGIVRPGRTEGNVRLFSSQDMERLKKIISFKNMGVNMAGIEIIMKLIDQMEDIKKESDIKPELPDTDKPEN